MRLLRLLVALRGTSRFDDFDVMLTTLEAGAEDSGEGVIMCAVVGAGKCEWGFGVWSMGGGGVGVGVGVSVTVALAVTVAVDMVRVAKGEPKNAAAAAATAAAAAAAAVEDDDHDDDDDDKHDDTEKELAAKHSDTGCIEQEVPSHLPCTHRHACMYHARVRTIRRLSAGEVGTTDRGKASGL